MRQHLFVILHLSPSSGGARARALPAFPNHALALARDPRCLLQAVPLQRTRHIAARRAGWCEGDVRGGGAAEVLDTFA